MEMRLLIVIIAVFLVLGMVSVSFSSAVEGAIYLLLLFAIAIIVIRFTRGIADVRNSDIEGN